MTNLAVFRLRRNAGAWSPSTDLGFDAQAGDAVEAQIETPAGVVRSALFEVFDPTASSPPFASKSAPVLTLVGGLASGQAVSPPSTPNGLVSVTIPSGANSWLLRCTVDGGFGPDGRKDPDRVYERLIVVRNGAGLRKVVSTEGTAYSARGDADAQNELVGAWGNFGDQYLSTTGSVSIGVAAASTGALRLANGGDVVARNGNNDGNVSLLYLNSTNGVIIGGSSAAAVSFQTSNSSVVLGLNACEFTVGQIRFDNTVAAPTFVQEDRATNGATGETLVIAAQNATGTTSTGGDLRLKSGTGTTTSGALRLFAGNNNQMSIFDSGIDVNTAQFGFSSSVVNPVFAQNTDTAATVTGDTLTIRAQNCSGATNVTAGALVISAGSATGGSGVRNGGAITLSSGTGATSDGELSLKRGATTILNTTSTGVGMGFGATHVEAASLSGRNVVALCKGSAVTTTEMPDNTGDRVVYWANATPGGAVPTTGKPVGGNIAWSDNTANADSFLLKNPAGGVWSQSPQGNWHRYYRRGTGNTNSTGSTTVATIGMGAWGNGGGMVTVYLQSRDATNSFATVVYAFGFTVQGGALVSGTTTPAQVGGSNGAISSVALAYPGSSNVNVNVVATNATAYTHEVMFEVTFHPNAA